MAAKITRYFETCDGSGAVALDERFFAVCNDERNSLRIYPARSEAKKVRPIWSENFSEFLDVARKNECDLEGGARIGDLIYWIGSHGTDSTGEEQVARRRLFATKIVREAGQFALREYGHPFKHLLRDLIDDERYEGFKLEKAALRATKTKKGLNIEALGATPAGELLVGFRSPQVKNEEGEESALLVRIKNPQELVRNPRKKAKLGAPILLDLDGLGFREIVAWKTGYLILAGAYDAEPDFALYFWSGWPGDEPEKLKANFGSLRPEGLVVYPGNPDEVQVLSDDGTLEIDGERCKDLPKKEQCFRSIWLKLPKL